jgi:bifunctional isochorismate lyase/aryl carrier protein
MNSMHPGTSLPTSLNALRTEIATLLEVPAADILDDDNLRDFGLDSIRLVILAERWKAIETNISFVTLAEQPTLTAWWALLHKLRK